MLISIQQKRGQFEEASKNTDISIVVSLVTTLVLLATLVHYWCYYSNSSPLLVLL